MATVEQSKHLSAYWQEQIDTWAQTEQTQKSFCEAHNLDYHRFGYWKRKLREQRSDKAVRQGSGFVSVRQTGESSTRGLTLTLPNGIKMQGIELHNLPVVSQLLQQLS